MTITRRILAPFTALALLGACAVVPQAGPEQPPAERAETVQPAAVPPVPAAAEPLAIPSPDPGPTGPATFVYAGELTQGGWIRGQAPAGTISARLGDEEIVLDEQGYFFAAFDRDAAGQTDLVATLEDGRTIRSPVSVGPRDWNIEHVNVARRPGGASEAFMRRRRPELAQIAEARSVDADATGWSEDFIWPLQGRISGRFGSQRVYRGEPGSYHSGIDIATGGTGNPFVAPASGIVTLATREPFSLEGHLLIIDHGQGLNSAFLHLSEIAVAEGERVEQGQYLGRLGSSGRATGPHLHWSLKWRDARLDPLLFTGPMPR